MALRPPTTSRYQPPTFDKTPPPRIVTPPIAPRVTSPTPTPVQPPLSTPKDAPGRFTPTQYMRPRYRPFIEPRNFDKWRNWTTIRPRIGLAPPSIVQRAPIQTSAPREATEAISAIGGVGNQALDGAANAMSLDPQAFTKYLPLAIIGVVGFILYKRRK